MDGLWTAEFGSTAGRFAGGVVVFRDGQILGGDNLYFYRGNYQREGNVLTATLQISPFVPGGESIFGTVGQELTLDVKGELTGESLAIAQGTMRNNPSLTLGVKLTKRT